MKEANKFIKIIWNYHLMNHKITKADLIFVLGSSDIQVAHRASELFLQNWAPLVVISGGYGRRTKEMWGRPEADVFCDVMVKNGVPRAKILLENKSANTGENVIFTKKLLEEKRIEPKTILAVQKPFMERRAYATIKNFWPEVDVIMTSPQIPLEKYKIKGRTKRDLINAVVGNLQRIKEYPKRGFQIKQKIPKNVWFAYEELIRMGYTEHLM